MIYMDYAAAEPVLQDVKDFLFQEFDRLFYNPSSANSPSQYNHLVMDNIRGLIASKLNCKPEEILFTSGASESNSLGVDGYLRCHPEAAAFSTGIEHASIVDNPHVHTFLDVDKEGFVDLEKLERMVNGSKEKNIYIVGHANNVLGTIQDIETIGNIIGEQGIFFVDAAQTFMKEPIDVQKCKIDLLSVSAGKFGGIRGTGFLYVREGIDILPLSYGTQEENRRGGTYFNMGIECMGEAIRSLDRPESNHQNYLRRITMLRNFFIDALLEIEGVHLLGPNRAHLDRRLYNNIYIKIDHCTADSQSLVGLLEEEGFIVSADSACHVGEKIFSHVLKAIGETEQSAPTCCRITIGKDTSVNDILSFVETLKMILGMTRDAI